MTFVDQAQQQPSLIANYYYRQSRIYDATRWSFLMGRKSAIHQLPLDRAANFSMLEVGCGTGTILHEAARRYPNARLHGLDCSPAMLGKAQRKLRPFNAQVKLHQMAWDPDNIPDEWSFDTIVMAYTLTMLNPNWQTGVDMALQCLKPGGYLSVVDFHDTPFDFYRQFMKWHHVSLDGHLLPYLKAKTINPCYKVKSMFGGCWRYLVFRGQRPLT